jgi:hypothetical protein
MKLVVRAIDRTGKAGAGTSIRVSDPGRRSGPPPPRPCIDGDGGLADADPQVDPADVTIPGDQRSDGDGASETAAEPASGTGCTLAAGREESTSSGPLASLAVLATAAGLSRRRARPT